MQLNIKSIKREGHIDFDTTCPLPRIANEVIDIADMQPVHFTGTATFVDPLVMVEGVAETVIEYICSRCLTRFERLLTTRISVTYTTDTAESDDDIETVLTDTLNLTPDLEEAIFLSIDDRPLCRADCKGLCSECGCNRNEETCQCDVRAIDPRLAALKDLLSDNESE